MRNGSSSRALILINMIQWCGGKGRVVLRVPGKELDCISNCAEKVFDHMGNIVLVGRIIDGNYRVITVILPG